MKRKVSVLFVVLIFFMTLCLGVVACQKGEVQDVVIMVENATQGQTLLSYMQELQEENKISFVLQNGMVTKINGTSNAVSSYWMLYTTDVENANTAWGTYEYNGQTLGSAISGAETLIVKNGETYVWTYQTF